MRMVFVPDDRLDEEPEIDVRAGRSGMIAGRARSPRRAGDVTARVRD
jgi:hypothetical protein